MCMPECKSKTKSLCGSLVTGLLISVFTVVSFGQSLVSIKQDNVTPGLGVVLSQADSDDLPQHVFSDGEGLPAGSGNATRGGVLYAEHCAACHGSFGQGGKAIELVGDRNLLTTDYPDRGIGVYWPFAPTLYEYIHRSMPPENPVSFSPDELYSLVAHLLELNGLFDENSALDAAALRSIEMPNRLGFITIAK